MKAKFFIAFTFVFCLCICGCLNTEFKLFTDNSDPLTEQVISGTSEKKILIITVNGVISDQPEERLLRQKPSMVQEIVSQLNLARKDKGIKAVVLKINSPGGSVTASDIIYHEILKFKKETSVKIVVSMMDIAASGGLYISLPADFILAHPTTITGSVGVITFRPDLVGLMDKIGVSVEMDTSGRNKAMGSPFRNSTKEESAIFQAIIDEMAERFLGLVKKHRNLDDAAMEKIATARIFTASQAKEAGLVDKTGYLDDALDQARKLADLPDNARIIAYRRTAFPDDNIYNPTSMKGFDPDKVLIDLGPVSAFGHLPAGFLYLWLPGNSG